MQSWSLALLGMNQCIDIYESHVLTVCSGIGMSECCDICRSDKCTQSIVICVEVRGFPVSKSMMGSQVSVGSTQIEKPNTQSMYHKHLEEMKQNKLKCMCNNCQINTSLKQFKFREKLRDISDEKQLNDFDYVFNLCTQFGIESTSDDNINGFELENRDSDELLRRLYVFMCTNNKYCVRFAVKNGIELTLKYLYKTFGVIKSITNDADKKEKLTTFNRPFSLLNVCCEKKVNFSELKKKKHLKLVQNVILKTMNYYKEMNENLQVQSMQFISVYIMAMNDILVITMVLYVCNVLLMHLIIIKVIRKMININLLGAPPIPSNAKNINV